MRNKNGNYIVKIYGLQLLKCWTRKLIKVNEKSGYNLIYNSAKLSNQELRKML